ncbi:hypothetical protein [Lichenihabitans psoromatis]|uniref:hypothetical protein n=1 Tax=Lichenihabitans psoromatis TaxID=2528642 RepID=UPI001036666A|nr:hypothetical protein [Lichenihabitans psoromatis]
MRLSLCRVSLVLTLVAAWSSVPAYADSMPFQLTPTWQKIATAGQTVDVQNTSGVAVLVSTSSGSAVPALAVGQVLLANQHRLYVLAADLYALSSAATGGTIIVTPGLASAGGTVAQGAAGGTAWPTADSQNAAFSDFTALTIGGPAVAVGRSVEVIATVAGNVTFSFLNGKTKMVPVAIGYQAFAYAVTGVAASTATATINNLY